MRLNGKVALITGGNSGIGLATARRFVAEGARVAIIGRNQQTMDTALAELGASAMAVHADVTDVPALEAAVAQVAARLGPIDILFANAGIGGATPLGQTSWDSFEKVIRTNLTSVFFSVQAAAPHLRDGASIILNSSVHNVLGAPGYAAYAAAKAGVVALNQVLAAELSPRGIRVNVVSPGPVVTPAWDRAAPTPERMEQLKAIFARETPLERTGEMEEIANAVLFLASDEASYVHGTELYVDGGRVGAPLGAPMHRR